MKFLACDGEWLADEQGSFTCQGQLTTFTLEELRSEITVQITAAQKEALSVALISFFVLIFCLVKLRRLAH
ncbi:hypothetical protein D9M68_483600 [compost metagenome]